MQTFLPFASFDESARVLDSPRLGKQRVETLQILRALIVPTYGWQRHPAVGMWRNHVPALTAYGLAMTKAWTDRGFADSVRKAGTHFWVQTPYRYFPLEPHLVFPGFQFLPPAAKVKVAQHWPLSHIRGRSDVEPVAYVMDHELVTVTEMETLFPGADVLRERVGPLVKSLVATA